MVEPIDDVMKIKKLQRRVLRFIQFRNQGEKEDQKKTYGQVIVKYQKSLTGDGIIYLDHNRKVPLVSLPMTGDERIWGLYMAGILVSVLCGLWIHFARRKSDE